MSENKAASLTELEQVPDYRFARLTKSERYAYARGLTINPVHLPLALDAMLKDGWRVISVFGHTDSENVGFLFEQVTLQDPVAQDRIIDGFMSTVGKLQADLFNSEHRIINLLNSNNALVEQVREQRERLRRFEIFSVEIGE